MSSSINWRPIGTLWNPSDPSSIQNILQAIDIQMRVLTQNLETFRPWSMYRFFQENVPASQTDVALPVLGAPNHESELILRNGQLYAIGAVFSGATAGSGTARLEPTLAGSDTLDDLDIPTDGSTAYRTLINPETRNSVQPGSRLGLTITTPSGWTSTTIDILAYLVVEHTFAGEG